MEKPQLAVERWCKVKYPNITLGRVEAVWNKLGGEEGVESFLRGELTVSEPQTPPLLIPIGTVDIPATTTPFIARNRFVQNTNPDAPVKISYLGNNFTEWFLGKTEEPFQGSTLRYGKLSRNSVDGPIIDALGGEEKAETTLTELFSLLTKQPDGEKKGPLLTNGWWNIFYIKDANKALRAVRARWSGSGWRLGADAVTIPVPWGGGRRFFSRDSRGGLAS